MDIVNITGSVGKVSQFVSIEEIFVKVAFKLCATLEERIFLKS